MRLTDREWNGVKRPERGPYPKGVVNGPQPTTERGIRRRKASVPTSTEKIELDSINDN